MTGIKDALLQGDLGSATASAIDLVRRRPSDAGPRVALFELLSVAGQFERAEKHLEALAQSSPAVFEAVTSYIGVLRAERRRAAFFDRGEGAPEPVSPLPWRSELLEDAARAVAAGDSARARECLDGDATTRVPVRAVVDGQACESFVDADDLFAETLEVFGQGRWGWLPFEAIESVVIEEPRNLRDLLWAPAEMRMIGGLSSRMFLPVRYPGSEACPEDAIKLARVTDWTTRAGLTRGVGQRAFLVGDELRPLLEIREIVFAHETSVSGAN